MEKPVMVYLLMLWIALFINVVKGTDLVCLVSSAKLQFSQTSFYYYPIDLYSQVATTEEKRKTFPCSAYDGVNCGHSKCHLCSLDASFCPLFKENVQLSVLRSSHLARSSLCILKEKLTKKSETVNVYVTGGSVTVGSYAGGCCASGECNRNKPSLRVKSCVNGANTVYMADDLATRLRQINARPFTSSDLILVDHSVNDNASGAGGLSIASGVEMLIRRLYHHSAPGSLPTIVLLDADPRSYLTQTQKSYYEAYEKVGRYYDIPVWSYRDAVLSNFSNVNQSQYVKFLNFKFAYNHHPSWHVHLFMADLYAGIFTHDTLKYCTLDNSDNKVMLATNTKMRSRTVAELPSPLSATAGILCETELLSLSYNQVTENLSPVGSYQFEPERGGWNFSTDQADRRGGFLVAGEAPDQARVIFTLNITTRELIEKRVKFQLFIHYLRSYDNGGKVRIKLCNQQVNEGVLDALWEDYKTRRFSLPDLYTTEESYFNFTMCQKDFKYKNPTIELIFNRDSVQHRGNQKFKLLNIRICRLS